MSDESTLKEWVTECSREQNEKAQICKRYFNLNNISSDSFRDYLLGSLDADSSAESILSNLKSIKWASVTLAVHKLKPQSQEDLSFASLVLIKHKDILEDMGLQEKDFPFKEHIEALLKDKDYRVRGLAVQALEEIDNLANSPFFNEEQKSLKASKNYCIEFCAGSKKLLDTLHNPPTSDMASFFNRPSIFNSAVDSLKLLTLFRASRLCPQKELLAFNQKLQLALTAINNSTIPSDQETLQYYKHITEILSRTDASPGSSTYDYEQTFTLQLLADIHSAHPSIPLSKITKTIQSNVLGRIRNPKTDSIEGSRVNTYSYSTLFHSWGSSQEDPVAKKELLTDAKLIPSFPKENPLIIPYNPTQRNRATHWQEDTDSERASAARALVFYTALYNTEVEVTSKANTRAILFKALENYFFKYFDDLAAHLQRGGVHDGPDNIAPYYLYPSLMYSYYAFQGLESDKSLTHEEKEKLLKIKTQAQEKVSSLIRENGEFALTGDDKRQNETGYGGFYGADQAMGLLALSSFAECSDMGPNAKAIEANEHSPKQK
ncbi:MAG: hypothetical protein R3A80_11110 [Bdellovibrionota bacterium]